MKPSERIIKIYAAHTRKDMGRRASIRRNSPGVIFLDERNSGNEAMFQAILDYLDEQHAKAAEKNQEE